MNIEIQRLTSGNYYVDILDLSGSPYIGRADTIEGAVALAFTNNIKALSRLPEEKLFEVNIQWKVGAVGNTAVC